MDQLHNEDSQWKKAQRHEDYCPRGNAKSGPFSGFTDFYFVLVFYCCYNKLLQINSLIGSEVRSPAPSGGCEGRTWFLAFFSILWLPIPWNCGHFLGFRSAPLQFLCHCHFIVTSQCHLPWFWLPRLSEGPLWSQRAHLHNPGECPHLKSAHLITPVQSLFHVK